VNPVISKITSPSAAVKYPRPGAPILPLTSPTKARPAPTTVSPMKNPTQASPTKDYPSKVVPASNMDIVQIAQTKPDSTASVNMSGGMEQGIFVYGRYYYVFKTNLFAVVLRISLLKNSSDVQWLLAVRTGGVVRWFLLNISERFESRHLTVVARKNAHRTLEE
jgi:hypothetical protein